MALAAAFPGAQVVGLEPDGESVGRARAELARRGLGNARFEQMGLEDVSEAGFDVVLAYDCLHDMSDPLAALSRCRGLLKGSSEAPAEGVLLWFEPHGSDDPYENREILGARMVAGIALNCVATSMATG